MTKPTIGELQHEFDKRLKSYNGTNEVSDLWLPYVNCSHFVLLLELMFLFSFVAAVQDTLPEDDNGVNTLTNNQILYPICVKCLEKFENDSEQMNNRDFAEICLLIVSQRKENYLYP